MVSDEWVVTAMVYSVGTGKVIHGLVNELVIAFQLYVIQYHQHKNGTHLQNSGVQQVPEPVQPRERKARGLDPRHLRPWPLLFTPRLFRHLHPAIREATPQHLARAY